MIFIDLFVLNERLSKENQFSKNQWKAILDEAFAHSNEWNFDWSVENFYTRWLNFDYEDCEDLVMDIQNGNGNAFEIFINDIINYFNNDS